MKLTWYYLPLLALCLQLEGHSIILVHLGNALPTYIVDAVEQIRLFNAECDLYLIAHKKALEPSPNFIKDYNVHPITAESLARSLEHAKYLKKTPHRQGLWLYSSERFFYVYECMKQYNLSDVFHLENDIMVYVDFKELMPIFKQYYKGLGATFDNDERCIPGFVYIAHKNALKRLLDCFVEHAPSRKLDMEIVARFKKNHTHVIIDNLPIIMPSYKKDYPLVSDNGLVTNSAHSYSKYSDQFNSLFDAAALGQYLGGGGSVEVHGHTVPNFINDGCLFNPAHLSYEWHEDPQGRKIPYAVFKGTSYRINNLHIHSKKLTDFKS